MPLSSLHPTLPSSSLGSGPDQGGSHGQTGFGPDPPVAGSHGEVLNREPEPHCDKATLAAGRGLGQGDGKNEDGSGAGPGGVESTGWREGADRGSPVLRAPIP